MRIQKHEFPHSHVSEALQRSATPQSQSVGQKTNTERNAQIEGKLEDIQARSEVTKLIFLWDLPSRPQNYLNLARLNHRLFISLNSQTVKQKFCCNLSPKNVHN
jgi:hypothetical protein